LTVSCVVSSVKAQYIRPISGKTAFLAEASLALRNPENNKKITEKQQNVSKELNNYKRVTKG